MKRKTSNEIAPRKRQFRIFSLFGREETSVETPVSTPQYKLRVIRSCELHRSRSLLALGNCSMYCTHSCRLAETDGHEEMNG